MNPNDVANMNKNKSKRPEKDLKLQKSISNMITSSIINIDINLL